MWKESDSRVGSGPGGPYGPSNPAPPPPGPPPRKASGSRRSHSSNVLPPPQESSLAQKAEGRPGLTRGEKKRLYRQRQKVKQGLGRERSRSPSPDCTGNRNSEAAYRERSPMSRGNTRAQPLREAREYTPNQIIDETYGRLSCDTEFRKGHQEQNASRSSWASGYGPGEGTEKSNHPLPWSPKRVFHGAAGLKEFDFDKSERPATCYRPVNGWYNDDPQSGYGTPIGTKAERRRSGFTKQNMDTSYKGAPADEGYDMEDEVIWDDVEPLRADDVVKQPVMLPSIDSSQHRATSPKKAHWPTSNPWARPHPHARKSWDNPRLQSCPDDVKSKVKRKASYPDMQRVPQGPTLPASVYDLRKYDAHITTLHQGLARHERYLNGNGKVAPYMYGSIQGMDLGLCFSTFCTKFICEMSVKCAWRHHPLTIEEREWIMTYGRERGKQFLNESNKFWPLPEVPVPGACMHDK